MRNMQEFGIQIVWTITATKTPLTTRTTRSTRSTRRNPTMCAATYNTWETREHAGNCCSLRSQSLFCCCHTHPLHIAHWLKIFSFASHSIPWSSPSRVHELSVLSDFLHLFINFTFLLFIIFVFQLAFSSHHSVSAVPLVWLSRAAPQLRLSSASSHRCSGSLVS